MSIQLNCKCGRYFELDDGNGGRTIQCPSCDALIAVPARSDSAAHAPEAKYGVQAESENSNKGWGSQQGRDDDADYYNRAAERRERQIEIDRRFIKDEPKPAGGGFGTINAGVGGGFTMMAIGAVMFLVCLGLGRIPIYSVILFVIGLIALIKGIANGSR